MIIGVGMFGIPFSFWQSGFLLGMFELAVAALVMTAVHRAYGTVVVETRTWHRFPGYVALYLGKGAGAVAWGTALFGIAGTLLAYVALGAAFLHELGSRLGAWSSEFLWAFVITGVAALVTAFSLKREALINGILTALLISFVLGLSFFLFPGVEKENLTGIHFSGVWAPYGVLLFALAGGAVIPDVVALLGRDASRSRKAIMLGSFIPALVYAFFALAIVGVSGSMVSREAVAGLASFAGERVVVFGSIIGFLAVFTSLVTLGSSFQELLRLDRGFSRVGSWAAGSALPLALYLAGATDFLTIVAAVGAFAVGIDTVLTFWMHERLVRSSAKIGGRMRVAGKIVVTCLIAVGIAAHLIGFASSP